MKFQLFPGKALPCTATVLAAAAGLLGPAITIAQESDDSLEEIIVTAERRETDLQKTAISIQVMDGEQLKAEGKTRIDEMMDGIVGVSSQGSQVGTDFFMRGLGTQGGPPAQGITQSAVAVLIDGVYQNRGETVRGGSLDLQQVEVMRGTQSTTLGASSFAGAVSLVSRDPVFERMGSASVGFGNYNARTAEAIMNLPLSDNQAVRLAYSAEKRDGYISSGAGDSDQSNLRVKYRYQPNDDLDIVLTVQSQVIGGNGVDSGVLAYQGYWEGFNSNLYEDDSVCGVIPGPSPYATCMWDGASTIPLYGLVNDGVKYDKRSDPWDDGYPANSWPNDPFRHTTIDTYSANIDWQVGIGTLTVVPSYQEASFESMEPPRGNSNRAQDQTQKTQQLDVQLTSNPDAAFEWLAGLYWYDTEAAGWFDSYNLGNLAFAMAPPGAPVSRYQRGGDNPNAQTTFSAYLNTTFSFGDALRLNLGLRYSEDEKNLTPFVNVDFNSWSDRPTSFSEMESYTYGAKWDDTTYRVGLDYDINDDIMLYAVTATGYTAGRVSGFADPGGNVNVNVQPNETLDQYTFGMKSRFLDNKLQFNVEAFRSEYHDRAMEGAVVAYSPNWITGQQCMGPPGPPAPFIVGFDSGGNECVMVSGPAIPTLTSQGVDFELSWLLSDASRIDATVEYLDSSQGPPNVSFVTAAGLEAQGSADGAALLSILESNVSQYEGLTLQNSPEYTANLTWSYEFVLAGGSTLTPKLNMQYSDSYWSLGGGPGADVVNPGNSYQDAYNLFNAYLAWVSADGQVSANAYVRNIENEAIQSNYGTEAAGYVSLKPPRTYGVNLTYNF